MNDAIPIIVVALPFAAAAMLALVGSPVARWVNAGAASVNLIAACMLVGRADAAATHLVMLTAFVAMTTSWRKLTTCRVRLDYAGFQALIGAIQAAALAGDLMLTWLVLVVAVAAAVASVAMRRGQIASRLVRHGAIGLLVALLGTLLLGLAPDPAGVVLLVGYGALVVVPGTMIGTALLANLPVMLFMRLPIAPALLIAFGLAVLLPCAVAAFARHTWRRTMAVAGMAQLGMVVFAIGIGAKQAAWLHMTLLTLTRSAVLQSQGEIIAWMAIALLPLYALYLLAAPTAAVAAWLLVPLAAGALLTVWALLARRPAGVPTNRMGQVAVWLQLALAALLAFAMPAPVVAWFRTVAAG
jgi:hydrogenase-4 component F